MLFRAKIMVCLLLKLNVNIVIIMMPCREGKKRSFFFVSCVWSCIKCVYLQYALHCTGLRCVRGPGRRPIKDGQE